MKCETTREQLTAYLDGELEGDRGSALRGHLRTCEACRKIAGEEAALRDGLRMLPPVDPPASLWAGVQARLATAEMADADKPAWRRTLGRWGHQIIRPRYGALALGVAAAATILIWRSNQHALDPAPVAVDPGAVIAPVPRVVTPAPAPASSDVDVTADLANEAAATSQDYAAAAAELMRAAHDARGQWSDDARQTFDARVVELRHKIETADEGQKRHKAYRALIRYLQRAAVRDEVAMTDVQGAP
ncbi:MAG: superfamily protein [Myxococcales bacterium]|nr:superfamily protein [Myxococcales bacterium]